MSKIFYVTIPKKFALKGYHDNSSKIFQTGITEKLCRSRSTCPCLLKTVFACFEIICHRKKLGKTRQLVVISKKNKMSARLYIFTKVKAPDKHIQNQVSRFSKIGKSWILFHDFTLQHSWLTPNLPFDWSWNYEKEFVHQQKFNISGLLKSCTQWNKGLEKRTANFFKWLWARRQRGTTQHILTCQQRAEIRITHQKFGETFENMIGGINSTFKINVGQSKVCTKMSDWDKYLSQCLTLKHLFCQSCFFMLCHFAAQYLRFEQ